MARFFKKRKGFFLPQLIAMLLMLSVIGVASVTQLSTFLTGVEAGGDGLQAKQYAAIKAESIGSFDTAVNEARTLYPDSVFETEVNIGPEIDLGGGKKQKIATINVYKVGDAEPSFRLLKPLSSQGSVSGVPTGTIVMWSGSVATIPSGWTLCNGLNGTPDLRRRFVVGAGSDSGVHTPGVNGVGSGHYSPGDTGGQDTHRLTIAEMPAHSHNMYGNQSGQPLPWQYGYWDAYTMPSISDTGADPWMQGSDVAHENRPPYYALCFIMKKD